MLEFIAGSEADEETTDADERLAELFDHANDLIATLTSKQRDLLIGLSRGSIATVATLRERIPQGTRELFEFHGVLDVEGALTDLGEFLADQLAFEAGEGPDPGLVARAAVAEAALFAEAEGRAVGGGGDAARA